MDNLNNQSGQSSQNNSNTSKLSIGFLLFISLFFVLFTSVFIKDIITSPSPDIFSTIVRIAIAIFTSIIAIKVFLQFLDQYIKRRKEQNSLQLNPNANPGPSTDDNGSPLTKFVGRLTGIVWLLLIGTFFYGYYRQETGNPIPPDTFKTIFTPLIIAAVSLVFVFIITVLIEIIGHKDD